MQFLLSMIGEEPDFDQVSPEQMQEIMDAMGAYNEALHEAGAYVVAGGLQVASKARTVRFDGDGEATVSDGPFVETKEMLAGFWVIEADSIDDAVAWAERAPIQGASIEVRPFGAAVQMKPGESKLTAEELLAGAKGETPAAGASR